MRKELIIVLKFNICLINGKELPVILLDDGYESVIAGQAGARQMGLKPSMMDLGAALRVADGGTPKAFDRTKQPVEFVFNSKTPDKAKGVIACHHG
jgi:hypothetical protein